MKINVKKIEGKNIIEVCARETRKENKMIGKKVRGGVKECTPMK